MEAKKSNPIKVFLYISLWVIIWGTLGSFIDYPLYKNKIYLHFARQKTNKYFWINSNRIKYDFSIASHPLFKESRIS